ncbi:hypothetical protein H4Q26_013225 [Puccinia striiformis f. sp. tritici PST-130]|nr:hypothetical protein H4Q26_013225 [Puccinia striiformis f. sp. tritici PST-130]
MEEYRSLFPITSNLNKLLKSDIALSNEPEHLLIEQDLLTNPENQSLWISYIERLTEELQRDITDQRGKSNETQIRLLGAKLDSAQGRRAYQILVSVYERALIYFPKSFKLWRDYLQLRQSFILGQPAKKFNLAPNKKKNPQLKSAGGGDQALTVLDYISKPDSQLDDNERDMDGGGAWTGHLDSGLGYCEWKALASAHERSCQDTPSIEHYALPHTLHERIWKPYLRWSEQIAGGETCIRVWRRYLAIDPSLTAHYVQFLVAEAESKTALVAAKLLLGLVRKARKGKYKSPDGKSPYQLLLDFMELCEKFPTQVGISLKETLRRRERVKLAVTKDTETTLVESKDSDNKELATPGPFNGLIRMAGAPVPVNATLPRSGREKPEENTEAYDPDVDPANPSKLDIDLIVESEGLSVYKDQLGLLFTNLATYWIKRVEFDHARFTFENGISRVMTIRDFTTIFDGYAEFSEQYISTLMESLKDDDGGDEEEENELDTKMKEFEELMDRRPFLVNEVLLRRNPNDVQEWEKRIILFGNEDSDNQIVNTYLKAIQTINPKKSTPNFNQLFIHFAKWYEENGADLSNPELPDLVNARKVFEMRSMLIS